MDSALEKRAFISGVDCRHQSPAGDEYAVGKERLTLSSECKRKKKQFGNTPSAKPQAWNSFIVI